MGNNTAILQTALEDFSMVKTFGRASDFENNIHESELSGFSLIESQNFSFDPVIKFKQSNADALDSVSSNNALEKELIQQKNTIEQQELLLKHQADELEDLRAQQLVVAEKFQQGLEDGVAEIKNSLTKQIAVMLTEILGDVVKKTSVSAFVAKLNSFIDKATKPLIIEGNKNLLDVFKTVAGPNLSAYEFLVTESDELYVRYNEKIFATNIETIVDKLKEAYE
ncbi:hypothetical protein [Bartonella sp. TP]|uniref:hypothetical protein n=1 Tax=Bartonella sp. TP TaxID=3057550 RepID=UPI0025B02580|nr:hypothetical protein [Bartonella sp. TP]WJW80268.1 hypothetical protein QVL57_01505 [Bartonella sp. TP]